MSMDVKLRAVLPNFCFLNKYNSYCDPYISLNTGKGQFPIIEGFNHSPGFKRLIGFVCLAKKTTNIPNEKCERNVYWPGKGKNRLMIAVSGTSHHQGYYQTETAFKNDN